MNILLFIWLLIGGFMAFGGLTILENDGVKEKTLVTMILAYVVLTIVFLYQLSRTNLG
jgi:hypothetical protein